MVLFYVEDIFREAGSIDNARTSAVIIGIVQMIGSVVTPLVVDKYGRKILLVISSIGSSLTLAILGTYFFLKDIDYDLNGWTWVPLVTLVLYIVSYCIGWGPVVWIVLGEYANFILFFLIQIFMITNINYFVNYNNHLFESL